MGKNDFQHRLMKQKQAMLEVGMDTGFQKCWDLIQICLRDPEAVGKDTFGKERMKKLHAALMKHERDLGKAMLPMVEIEADKKQDELDALLREIWGDELVPFYERYPYIKPIDYSKGRKEWK